MIIAVDYDGTLSINGQTNIGLIKRLKGAQRRGDIVILWTCRSGGMLAEACANLVKHGFKPNYINENAPQVIAKYGDSRKIYADVYIDDKAAK